MTTSPKDSEETVNKASLNECEFLRVVRDTGFEPPPASLREALRARSDLPQTSLQIRSAEPSLELLLAQARFRFQSARLIIFQSHRPSMDRRQHPARFVLGNPLSQISSRTDVEVAVCTSQHVSVKHRGILKKCAILGSNQ
jgi:hypothetical protein